MNINAHICHRSFLFFYIFNHSQKFQKHTGFYITKLYERKHGRIGWIIPKTKRLASYDEIKIHSETEISLTYFCVLALILIVVVKNRYMSERT